jgi:hypothetical protein
MKISFHFISFKFKEFRIRSDFTCVVIQNLTDYVLHGNCHKRLGRCPKFTLLCVARHLPASVPKRIKANVGVVQNLINCVLLALGSVSKILPILFLLSVLIKPNRVGFRNLANPVIAASC